MADNLLKNNKQTNSNKLLKEEKEMEKLGAMACNMFNELHSEKKLCDALITADGVEFHAHKIILCGCSEYFRTLFTCYPPDQYVFSVPGVSAHIMKLIIEHVHGQQVAIDEENVHELLIAADYLNISDLVNKCCEVLKAQLRPETCVGIWCLVHFCYSLEKLKQQAFQMILFNFEEIVRISDEFLDLTVEQLSEIIENDYLNVKSENVVFDAVLKWTSHALQERKTQIGMLMPKVRMGLLTYDYFMNKVKNNTLVTKDVASWTFIDGFLSNKQLGYLTRPRLPNTILLAIGVLENDTINVIEAYDSRADYWIQVTCENRMPRYHQATVFLNGSVYCIGGYDGDGIFVNSVIRFDLITRTWTEVSPMYYCRCSVAACVLDGQIYTMGGYNGYEYLNTVERYNPETNQWSRIEPMQQQRSQAGAAALNSKVYVCGGFGGTEKEEYLSTVEYYSPQTGQWTLIPNMSCSRSAAGVTVYGGELYVVGGEASFLSLGSAEVYNPQTNSWRKIPDMITERSDFGIGVMDDRLFVVGGLNRTGSIRGVEFYDMKNSKWYPVKNMRISFTGLSCCVMSGLPNMVNYIAQFPKRSRTTTRR